MKTVYTEDNPVIKATIIGAPTSVLCFQNDTGKFLQKWLDMMVEHQGPFPMETQVAFIMQRASDDDIKSYEAAMGSGVESFDDALATAKANGEIE